MRSFRAVQDNAAKCQLAAHGEQGGVRKAAAFDRGCRTFILLGEQGIRRRCRGQGDIAVDFGRKRDAFGLVVLRNQHLDLNVVADRIAGRVGTVRAVQRTLQRLEGAGIARQLRIHRRHVIIQRFTGFVGRFVPDVSPVQQIAIAIRDLADRRKIRKRHRRGIGVYVRAVLVLADLAGIRVGLDHRVGRILISQRLGFRTVAVHRQGGIADLLIVVAAAGHDQILDDLIVQALREVDAGEGLAVFQRKDRRCGVRSVAGKPHVAVGAGAAVDLLRSQLAADGRSTADIDLEQERFIRIHGRRSARFHGFADLKREDLDPVDGIGTVVGIRLFNDAAFQAVAVVDKAVEVGRAVILRECAEGFALHAMLVIIIRSVRHIHADVGPAPKPAVVGVDDGIGILVQLHVARDLAAVLGGLVAGDGDLFREIDPGI